MGVFKKNEQGFALPMALGILATLMLIVGTAVTISQTQRYMFTTTSQLEESLYFCESALNRSVWLIMYDRILHPDRTPQKKNSQILTKERFIADGTCRKFKNNDNTVDVFIFDMNSGISLPAYSPGQALTFLKNNLDNSSTQEIYEIFSNRLMDYVDADDLLRNNSMEKTDYEALNLLTLPRNSPLQFREELLWIPGSSSCVALDEYGVVSDFNLIPPVGTRVSFGKTHFYSASKNLLQKKCRFTTQEVDQVVALRTKIVMGEESFEEAFANYSIWKETLKNNFSFNESSYYTIITKLSEEEGRPTRVLRVSLKISTFPSSNRKIQILEWIVL